MAYKNVKLGITIEDQYYPQNEHKDFSIVKKRYYQWNSLLVMVDQYVLLAIWIATWLTLVKQSLEGLLEQIDITWIEIIGLVVFYSNQLS